MNKKHLMASLTIILLFSTPHIVQASSLDTLFFDDFSMDMGWTIVDPYVQQTHFWHKDTLNAYSGFSWWCGSEQDTSGWISPPGYGDNWVQYLITPMIDISTVTSDTVILSFQHYYSLEAPIYPDGWDCCNLWASIDSGETWQILMPDTVRLVDSKYNMANSFAWHWVGLAPDWIEIPGWGGTNGSWEKASFDLSSFKGQKLMLKYAVVSDVMGSDQTYGAYHGAWYIDNISIDTVSAGSVRSPFFYDDLDTDTTIIWSTQVKEPSYYWHKINQTGNLCWISGNDSSVTFTWNQSDGIVSPFINLPDNADSCNVDFKLIYSDPMNGEGWDDNYSFEISEDSGRSWNALGTYVPPNQYSDIWSSYSSIYGNISLLDWLGRIVQFRILFYSDGDSLLGEPLMVDDFIVTAVNPQGVEGKPDVFVMGNGIQLIQNMPNPFATVTTIKYQLTTVGRICLKIYNINGQLINTLVDDYKQPGMYSETWNGKDSSGRTVANGLYFYRLEADEYSATKKMVVIK
jgi:hypothetical protein